MSALNLLDFFALRHTQLSHLEVQLKEVIEPTVRVQAKVELNLTPREMKQSGDDATPAYQLTARFTCHGHLEEAAEGTEPLFKVLLVLHAAYRQYHGAAIDFQTFTQHHTSLARQVYPVVHQQVRPILQQIGLASIQLPYDLVEIQPVSSHPATTGVLH